MDNNNSNRKARRKKMKIIVLAHKGGHLISAECESGKEALDAAHELISKGYKLDGHQAIK